MPATACASDPRGGVEGGSEGSKRGASQPISTPSNPPSSPHLDGSQRQRTMDRRTHGPVPCPQQSLSPSIRQVSSLSPASPGLPRLDAKSNTEAREEIERRANSLTEELPLTVAGCRERARGCPGMQACAMCLPDSSAPALPRICPRSALDMSRSTKSDG